MGDNETKLRAEGARSTVPFCSVHQQFTNVRRPISGRQSSFPSTLPIQVTILGARASQADHIVVLFRYLSARWGPFPARPKARTQRRQKPRSLRRCPRQLRRAKTSALSLPLPTPPSTACPHAGLGRAVGSGPVDQRDKAGRVQKLGEANAASCKMCCASELSIH